MKPIQGNTEAPSESASDPGSAPGVSLVALVDQARLGDEDAMNRLVLRVLPRVRNGVRYLVRGDHIDDLVQDVLVTILRRLDSYRGTGRFEAWVDGVTLRVVLGRTRQLRKHERRLAATDVNDVRLRHSDERYATSRQLVQALDQLPSAQREALVLHHVFGLTAPEVARQLGVPLETARSRLKVGMGQLRALLRVRRPMAREAMHDGE